MNWIIAKNKLNGRSHIKIDHHTVLHGSCGIYWISYYGNKIAKITKNKIIIFTKLKLKTIKKRLNQIFFNENHCITEKNSVWYINQTKIKNDYFNISKIVSHKID
jgi:hypothetical protein